MRSFQNFLINNYVPIILFLFSILICQFSGNRGVFPIDSFGHFDNGYRILKGDHPFKDYWVVSGPFLDYFQSIFFLLFGANWQSYLLSASLTNGILTLLIYFIFLKFNLKAKVSFFYAFCFSILAYPSSGTIFVDHHSTFFSILAIFIFIFAVLKNNKYLWSLLPPIIVLAFLSKQVPAAYVLVIILFVFTYHLILLNRKNFYKTFFPILISGIFTISFLSLFFVINSIEIKDFLVQYIYYPSEIGSQRFKSLNYDLKNIFLDFKFIYLAFIILVYLNVYNFLKVENYHTKINFKIFIILFFLFICLIQHTLLTKNQIFIFFLIPLLSGFAHIELEKQNNKIKNFLKYLLIVLCIFTTIKYHYRFNLDRKFHELSNVDFSNSIRANELNNKFSGLKWITPGTKTKIRSEEEIKYLITVKKILQNDPEKKVLITNYSIFSVLLDENISSFTRWYPGDNSAFPTKGSKYFQIYKELVLRNLERKKIKNIYILSDVKEEAFTSYINLKCFDKNLIQLDIIKFKINNDC